MDRRTEGQRPQVSLLCGVICQKLDFVSHQTQQVPGGLHRPQTGMTESSEAEPLCLKGQSKGPQDKQTNKQLSWQLGTEAQQGQPGLPCQVQAMGSYIARPHSNLAAKSLKLSKRKRN